MNKLLVFFVIFLIFGWFLFSFKITEVPPGINGDEAAIGYNAALVAKTGRDSSGRFLPLFVSTFDLTDWKQPVTFYSTVLAFKIFGTSYAMLRQVSVVLILISAVLIVLLSQELFGRKMAFISLAIFLTIPAILIQSHLALENIAPVPFTILWLWMLTKYQKIRQSRYLHLAGLFLGIELFTYPGLRIIFPVFFCLTLALIFYLEKKKNFKSLVKPWIQFAIIALIFPLIMWLVRNHYPGAILAYNRPHALPSYQIFFLSYVSSYDPSFLFITGDTTPYHSTGKQGVFLLATLPLFILGLGRIIRKKEIMLWFILAGFFSAPLLYGLAETVHRGSRLLVILPPYTIITTAGVLTLIKLKNKRWRIGLSALMLLLICLNYYDFARDYYFDYPRRVDSQFAKPYQVVFDQASQLIRTKHLNAYLQDDFKSQNEIAVNFFEEAFPGNLKKWKQDEPVPAKSVIIVSDYILLQKKTVSQINTDKGFGLLINESQNEIR